MGQSLPETNTLMQGTESWQFMDGDKLITVRPQGRFKADNGIALVSAATAGLESRIFPIALLMNM